MEPEKPFACSIPDCGMTFTNEDHLHVHTKKHDMVLQLGMGQKAAFVADQTPTPTRFIRNCEEVGLFQDLQNVTVNPFDEGFKRAMETKHGMLTLEGPSSSEDVLHTPHLVFPLESGDCTLYTANNQRNITISRSSSDESGAVKEYETTKISKLTNEVTTISRIVGKDDVSIVRHEESTKNKDILNETSVSYTNNVIIHSNVEIRQDINIDTKKVANNSDSLTKDPLNTDELVKFNDSSKLKEAPPIMSQKSLDFVVDSLTNETVSRDEGLSKNLPHTLCTLRNLKRNLDNNDRLNEKDGSKHSIDDKIKVLNEKDTVSNEKGKVSNEKDTVSNEKDNYEVIIKLPNGKHVRMKAVDEEEKPISAKEKLNRELKNKIQKSETPTSKPINVLPITSGTLIPVTLVNPNLGLNQNLTMNPTFLNPGLPIVQKIPIQQIATPVNFIQVKRRNLTDKSIKDNSKGTKLNGNKRDSVIRTEEDSNTKKRVQDLNSHSAASKRYRQKLKLTMQSQIEENVHLRKMNRRLTQEKAVLQRFITQHLKECPNGQDLSPDQTPTPTRFIRNCEEVGLFQDLQNVTVNPFDEGFKRAMETKHGMLTLEGPSSSEDVLHTPHLVFPLESGDCTLYTANNQRNITISRSSSDESGAVKEYETTKISKLTNEVTTISRIVGKDDVSIVRHEESTKNKDILNETSVSYTNNVIIHSNVEIRQDINIDTKKVANNSDSLTKDPLNTDELVKFNDSSKLKEAPPIMSQKSLDFVVDSLTNETVSRDEGLSKNLPHTLCTLRNLKRNLDNNDRLNEKDGSKHSIDDKIKVLNDKDTVSNEKGKVSNEKDTVSNEKDNYEVIIKLPNGKHVRMKAVDEEEKPISAKEKLNRELKNKIQKSETPTSKPINVLPITSGTLIPVTLVNPNLGLNQNLAMNPTFLNPGLPIVQKIPIQQIATPVNFIQVKRRNLTDKSIKDNGKGTKLNGNKRDSVMRTEEDSNTKKRVQDLNSHSAASKRYRQKLKLTMQSQIEENIHLRKMNRRLTQEKAVLQRFITQHLKECPNGQDLSRTLQEKLQHLNSIID